MVDHTQAIRQFNATEQGRQQRQSGVLAPLAIHQLRAWQELAKTWVVQFGSRDNTWHLICPACDQSILSLELNGGWYILSIEEMQAATVAHLRNRHRELDPDNG